MQLDDLEKLLIGIRLKSIKEHQELQNCSKNRDKLRRMQTQIDKNLICIDPIIHFSDYRIDLKEMLAKP